MKLSPRFCAAFCFAAEIHGHQMRKMSKVPYLSHLMAVTSIVLDNGGSEDEAIAALFHDSLEDQGENWGGMDRIKFHITERFGERVCEIVEHCSDFHGYPRPSWDERKKNYIGRIRKADHSVLLVSSADKLHNARAILTDYRELGEDIWERFHAPRDKQIWYYRELVKAFREAGAPPRIVDELDRVVSQIESLIKRAEEK